MKQLRVFKAFVLVLFALLSAAALAAATTIEELVAGEGIFSHSPKETLK